MVPLRRYERISTENRRPKISGRVAPTNHFSYQKIRLSDFSYDIKIWTHHSFVLLQITRLTDGGTDGQTDGETESLDRVCIPCSAVKTKHTSVQIKKVRYMCCVYSFQNSDFPDVLFNNVLRHGIHSGFKYTVLNHKCKNVLFKFIYSCLVTFLTFFIFPTFYEITKLHK